MASIKNNEHQHKPSSIDPREVEGKLCQLVKDSLHTTANDPTEAEKQAHQPDPSPPLDTSPTNSSPDNDNQTDKEGDKPRTEAKEANGSNNDPSPSPNDDNKTDKEADEDADETTTPAKEATKPDDQLPQPSEDQSNTPELDTSEAEGLRLQKREHNRVYEENMHAESCCVIPDEDCFGHLNPKETGEDEDEELQRQKREFHEEIYTLIERGCGITLTPSGRELMAKLSSEEELNANADIGINPIVFSIL
ncbi:hypothetical protein AnigIFM56816_004506 [Aspergillus niger]|nr:hypothetical protein AnigIFM56816_004506 [Aspergillus niger]